MPSALPACVTTKKKKKRSGRANLVCNMSRVVYWRKKKAMAEYEGLHPGIPARMKFQRQSHTQKAFSIQGLINFRFSGVSRLGGFDEPSRIFFDFEEHLASLSKAGDPLEVLSHTCGL
ncbi:MAG: hypothetical protein HRT36_02870 [Alphaproteobacteria bacterium]|nr:hypothetical protein [Alphaproteobacteria bacterium]